jgi:hypothetical protein
MITEKNNLFHIVPEEIIGSIVCLCDLSSLSQLTKVCRRFSDILSLAITYNSVYINEICARILCTRYMPLIDRYFPLSTSTDPKAKNPIPVRLYTPCDQWLDVPNALAKMARSVSITALTFNQDLTRMILVK